MAGVLTPRIYVGAGGSGRKMVARLKKAVFSDPNLSVDDRRAFQFLVIDTDEYQEQDCQPLERHREYVHIGGFRPGHARKADFMEEPLKEWWYETFTPPYIQQGAGAVRLIGRLCFFYHYRRIRDAFQQALQRATDYSAGREVAGEVTVYIIGSLAGGTGSSMFLDLGFLARKSCNYQQVYVNAVLILPDVFTVTQVLTQQKFKDRWMANGYAALKELVYFNELPREFVPFYRPATGREEAVDHPRMFDQCFFIEPVLGNTSTVSKDEEVFGLAAQSVYLFSASAHGSTSGSVLVNTPGIHYASLGMQSIAYPHEGVVNFTRYWGTAQLLRHAIPRGAEPAEEKAAKAQMEGDLQTAGMTNLQDVVNRFLAEVGTPDQRELDPEGNPQSEVQSAMDQYRTDIRHRREKLEGWVTTKAEAICQRIDQRLAVHLQEGRSLGWAWAYIDSLSALIDAQTRTLEEDSRRRGVETGRTEESLKQVRVRGRLGGWLRPRQAALSDLEDRLYQLYAEDTIRLVEVETTLKLARHLSTQWLRPRLLRFGRLKEWALGSEIKRQEEKAAREARQLDEQGKATPHTQYCITGADLPRLAQWASAHSKIGIKPLLTLWGWLTRSEAGESFDGLLQELQGSVAAAYGEALDLTMLDAWNIIGDEKELKNRFLAAALSCRPFWSYVEEQAGEHMTRVAVLSKPKGASWATWLEDLRLDLKVIDGDDRRVVFLTVEGCRHLKEVHLKELPEWFRKYEQLQREYQWGDDERPLHVHVDWHALPEIDGLMPNAHRLFGPALVRKLIIVDNREYVLNLPASPAFREGVRVSLGRDQVQAMRTMTTLSEEHTAALWKEMERMDTEDLLSGLPSAVKPYRVYVEEKYSGERLKNEHRATKFQLEEHISALRQKTYGHQPGPHIPLN